MITLEEEFKTVVTCPNCQGQEYYGMMHWRDGHQYCRACIYRIWEKDTNYRWKPGPNEKLFPVYPEGK